MAGIERDTPIPSEIKLHQKSRLLEIAYESGERFKLDFEYLRVYTPSAEARGHGPGQETLQTGKRTPCASSSRTDTTAASTLGTFSTIWANITTNCGRNT